MQLNVATPDGTPLTLKASLRKNYIQVIMTIFIIRSTLYNFLRDLNYNLTFLEDCNVLQGWEEITHKKSC